MSFFGIKLRLGFRVRVTTFVRKEGRFGLELGQIKPLPKLEAPRGNYFVTLWVTQGGGF